MTSCFATSSLILFPCVATSALLAVMTDLPFVIAFSTNSFATPSEPPTNSITTSILSISAISRQSAIHLTPVKSTFLFLSLLFADTATTLKFAELRALRKSLSSVISLYVSAPTVPSPAIAMLIVLAI